MDAAPRMMATLLAAAASAAGAVEGGGLQAPDTSAWPRWQARLSIGTDTPLHRSLANAVAAQPQRLRSLSLVGDYYFDIARDLAPSGGGFRATSGLLLGARSGLLLPTSTSAGGGFAVDQRRVAALADLPGADASTDTSTVPYVGLGYTGLAGKSGWGFSADIGLMALNPGSAVKFGRMLNGQSLDDLLRDLRLSPVLQLGVSYSF